jgi:hypothetical protein
MDYFDLPRIETLKFDIFSGRDVGRKLPLRYLPRQLTTLVLMAQGHKLETPVDHEPYLMPNLVTLHLGGITIEGPLQANLKLPSLKHLLVSNVSFEAANHTGNAGRSEGHSSPLVDMLFSPRILGLESLTLWSIAIDEALILELGSCRNLHSLRIGGENVAPSISSFSEYLNTNEGSFSALRIIKIETFEAPDLAVPYKALGKSCASRRPEIDLYLIIKPKLRIAW